ncbi:MAG: Gldg family protein [Planctomycetota bacterium]
MTNSQRSVLATALVLVITLCSTFLITQCGSSFGRIDTTQGGLFTLSEGSRKIIAGLQKPLQLRLFYSKSLVDRTGIDQWREINNLYYNVRDLLRSYERESGGKLTLLEFDPKAFSDAEKDAEDYGVQRLQDIGSDGLFFGMAVTSDSGWQAIPVFDVRSQSQIEYQISEAIELSTQRKKSKVGVLSSLDPTGDSMSPMMRQQLMMQGKRAPDAWASVEVLKRYYDVSSVPADSKEIDAGLDYLLVVQPKNLSDETLFAIDQFVMRGGKLIAFVDPYAPRVDQAPQDPQNPYAAFSYDASSDLNKLFAAWGVEVPKDKIVGDRSLALPVQARRGGTQRLLSFMALEQGRGVTADMPITQGITQPIAVYFPGAIQRTANAPTDVEVTPILQTTAEGNTYTAERFELANPDPQKLDAKFNPGVQPVTIAARVMGKLKSAFPDGLPKPKTDEKKDGDQKDDAKPDEPKKDDATAAADQPKDGEKKADDKPAEAPHLTECKEPNTVLIFADVDMLADGLAYQRFGPGMVMPVNTGNGAVFNNAIDYLAGSTALMSIRSRGEIQRKFEVVDKIEREADAKSQDQIRRIKEEQERFQKELSDLSSQATTENVGLLRNDAIQKKRELEKQVREKERALIAVQREKTEGIEALGSRLQWFNVAGVPCIVLLVGAVIWFLKLQSRRAATGGAA